MADTIEPKARDTEFAEKPEIEVAKRFRCSECPKIFERAYALDQHMPTHTGESRYKCSKCPKKFRRQCDCNRHEKLQHAEKGFICSGCGARFRRADALKEHLKSEKGRTCFQAVPKDEARKLRRDPQRLASTEYQLLSTASSTLNDRDIDTPGVDSSTQANTGNSESGRSEHDINRLDARQIAKVALPTPNGATPAIAPDATESPPIPSYLFNIAESLNNPSTSLRPALCLACFQCFSDISALREHVKFHAVECQKSQYLCWDCGLDFHCPITFTAHWASNKCGGDLDFIDYLRAEPHYRASRLHWGCGASFENHSSLKAHLDSSTGCVDRRIAADQTIEMTARIYIRILEISQEKRNASSSEQDAPGSPFSVDSECNEFPFDETPLSAPNESEVFSPPSTDWTAASAHTDTVRLVESDYKAESVLGGSPNRSQRSDTALNLGPPKFTAAETTWRPCSSITTGSSTFSNSPSVWCDPPVTSIHEYIMRLANPARLNEDASSSFSYSKRALKHPSTFQCSLCPRRFRRAYNLRSHLRTHTDERPFVCSVCGKAFTRQHERKRHEGLHADEKKIVCRGNLKDGNHWGCGRRFAHTDALDRHFESEAGHVCIRPLLEENVIRDL